MTVRAETVFQKNMSRSERQKAAKLADVLMSEHLTLKDLRKAQEKTQVKLAKKLGKNQVTIAQMEKRADMLLSTLRSYIEAMGGKLNLVVEFPDRAPVILDGLSNTQS